MEDILYECSRYWPDATRKSIRQEMIGPNEMILYMDDGTQWCYDSIDKSIRRLRLDAPEDISDEISDERWCQEFGERLCIIMRSRGLTQEELADRLGMSQPALSRYVRGSHMPGLRRGLQIARALRCDLNELIDF